MWLANGSSKPIEQVRQGEEVLSRNATTGKVSAKKVEHTSVRLVPSTLLLKFSDGSQIETTDEHPFYVEGKGFQPAKSLGIGTSIVTRAGPALRVLDSQVQRTRRFTT